MTWKEFKDAIEAQGVTDDNEVYCLDLYPEHGVSVGWVEFPAAEFRKPDSTVTKCFYVLQQKPLLMYAGKV